MEIFLSVGLIVLGIFKLYLDYTFYTKMTENQDELICMQRGHIQRNINVTMRNDEMESLYWKGYIDAENLFKKKKAKGTSKIISNGITQDKENTQ